MIIFGAAAIGEVTLLACRMRGIPVECFADDRIAGPIHGVPVIHTDDLKERYPDASFYLTSPNIEDMILRLKELGYSDWKSCGEVLQGFESGAAGGYTAEHVKYLIRTALHHHANYQTPERLTVQSVDLMITERCSMKCRDCSNLMQYYDHPENADLAQLYAMIDGLCANMDEVYEFRVIGGEPFMHKELHTVVAHLASLPKVKKVSIFTNATILPKEHQWEAFKSPKVRFFITDYDHQSRNLLPLTIALQTHGIAFVSEKANGWTECASLEKHNRTVEGNQAIWAQCCAKNLATLADGRLYRCPFAANAHKLGAVDYPADYVTVAEAARGQIKDFLRGKTYIETCDHCNGRSYGDKVIEPAIQTKVPLKFQRFKLELK